MGKLLIFVIGVALGTAFSSVVKTKVWTPIKTWILGLFTKKSDTTTNNTTSTTGATASK